MLDVGYMLLVILLPLIVHCDDDNDVDDFVPFMNFQLSYQRKHYVSEIRHASVVVVSPLKLSDEVTSPTVSHWLEPTDSQGDAAVPVARSQSSSESAAQPQPSGHEEPYELSYPERPYYDAVQPRPPLPSQAPSGMLSDCILSTTIEVFSTKVTDTVSKNNEMVLHMM